MLSTKRRAGPTANVLDNVLESGNCRVRPTRARLAMARLAIGLGRDEVARAVLADHPLSKVLASHLGRSAAYRAFLQKMGKA